MAEPSWGIGLADVRRQRGYTQQEVAAAMGTTQSAVSRLERQPDVMLSTLVAYASALGGRLRVVVDVHGGSIELPLPIPDENRPTTDPKTAHAEHVASVECTEPAPVPEPMTIPDLMAALEASLEAAERERNKREGNQ